MNLETIAAMRALIERIALFHRAGYRAWLTIDGRFVGVPVDFGAEAQAIVDGCSTG